MEGRCKRARPREGRETPPPVGQARAVRMRKDGV